MVQNKGKNILLISSSAIFSRFLGLGRDLILAWVLGSAADALTLALRIPHFFRRLLAEGYLSLNYTSALIQKQKFKSLSLPIFLIFLLLFIFSEYFMKILAWGMAQEQIQASANYFRLALPYCLFALLASQQMAKLHAQADFKASSFSPALFNIVSISLLGLAYYFLQTNPYYFSLAAALSMSLAGLAQYLNLALATKKLPLIHTESHNYSKQAPKTLANIFLSSSLQINFLLCACLASFLPLGRMSALFYAEKIIELPMSILALALTWIASVQFNQAAANRDFFALGKSLSQNIQLNLALAIPAYFGLLALSPQIVNVLFLHGNFDLDLAKHTSLALSAYAPCLIFNAILAPFIVASRALNLNNAKFSLLALAINLGSGFIFIQAELSLAYAVSLALACNALFFYLNLKKYLSFKLNKKALTKQVILSIFIYLMAKVLASYCSDLMAVTLSIVLALEIYFYFTKDFWIGYKHDFQNTF